MTRLKLSAGAAVVAVSLVSVLAPINAQRAHAQQVEPAPTIEHTQPSANEMVPTFVAKGIVQALPNDGEPSVVEPAQATSLHQLVTSMSGDAVLDEQLKCLAGAIYFEARGEPLAGQLAVGKVVINRAASGRFPASYCGVVLQKSQFSFVKRGRMPSPPADSATWQRAKAIAQIAHRGLWDSEAEGSLYFHARSVSPGWGKRRQAMARISNHVFYR